MVCGVGRSEPGSYPGEAGGSQERKHAGEGTLRGERGEVGRGWLLQEGKILAA